MKKYISIITALLLPLSALVAQNPVPAKKQTKSILLMNGVAHIGNGTVIQNSVIGFKDGKIYLVGDATVVRINKTEWDTIINIYGKQVYPGFIAPNSTLGLTDIEAVRATNDFHDIDGMNPHVRSQASYNTDSRIQPTVRTNGVLVAQVTPRGGRISGTSSIMSLDGWNWMDATLRADDGVHLNWPSWYSRSWNEDDGFSAYSQNKNYETQKQTLEKFFTEAQAYYNNASNPEKNLRFEAMKNIFNGTENLYIHADLVKEINEAVYFIDKFSIAHAVIVGGSDSWQCTDILKQHNIPVMLTRTHSLPLRNDDDVDQPYKTAKELQDAGILFCLQNEGDMEAMGARNLPFLAGTTVAYGLTQEQAIAALTGNSAKILRVDDLLGTLEINKDATLFISEGDALDMKTNDVTLAFIQGRMLDLSNDQQALYQRYETKYNLKDQ
ncbi:MAG TPA: amidohydrolase [Bacteroidia bacterium]|jgi:imidazolonepropionase-like amidohydrolase|nr:amidohydrolase [Bacteroidia bacterium]